MATRYNSYDSRSSTSSYFSDPLSSTELKITTQKPTPTSRAIINSKLPTAKPNNSNNLTTMVKKFMEKKSSSSSGGVAGGSSLLRKKGSSNRGLVIPSDVIAEDLKKTARKAGNFSGLQRKLFGNKTETKALVELKGSGNNANTRTLAMVLRSERELLNANKDQEMEISQLKLLLEERTMKLRSSKICA
ncbi:hypothetical protein LWI28_015695 [Acer negundo]|uniref:Uncharacterized protein n=1 Tax=Acer negundo TaxID=4023 RepID=A0AAD5NIX9_ACENE|nr:hypothetical protein LWI28_015695 [Acer negundo]